MPDRRPGPALGLAKLIHRARARGLAEVAGLGLGRVQEAIRSDDALIFFSRAAGGSEETRPDATLQPAGAADAALYAGQIGTEIPATFVERLSSSTRCFLVRGAGRRLLHASWVTTSAAWTRELRCHLAPPRGDAYVFESFTTPPARGKGIYPFALAGICARLAGEASTVWVAVEADNPASIRAVAKAGFEESFRLPYRRRLGRLWIGTPVGRGAGAGPRCLEGHPGGPGRDPSA